MAKVLLATLGSLGDLHPFIALARALEFAGCETTIATLPDYDARVRAAGIRFWAAGPSSEQRLADLGMGREEFARHILADTDFIFRGAVYPYLRQSYDALLEAVADSDLILTSSLSFAAQMAADKVGRPRLAVVLQPSMFLSAYDPPLIDEFGWFGPMLTRLPASVAGAVLRAVKSVLAHRAGAIRRLRQELDLPRMRKDPIFDGQFTEEGAIALYSHLLASVQPDYPHPTIIAGFAFYDGDAAGRSTLDDGLTSFLSTGAPPIVFTIGSFATEAAGDFFEVSVRAARRLGCRAVLLVGESAAVMPASDDVIVRPYAPYSLLFPCARIVVHHGGIGTTAQALRAGRPQLIVPIFADQPDNAARAARLGVARVLRRARYTQDALIGALKIAESPDLARRAREVSAQIALEDGATRAAQAIMDRLHRGASAAASVT